MKNTKKDHNKKVDSDHIDEMNAFIKSKKEENKALKKIIEKLNSGNKTKNKN